MRGHEARQPRIASPQRQRSLAASSAGRIRHTIGDLALSNPFDPGASRPRPTVLAVLAGAACLAGCVSTQELVQDHENKLAAAGFVVRPANTPERQAALASLPPNRVVQRFHDDKVAYLYADPVDCKCLYVGNQGAYSRYQQQRLQQHLADEQVEASQFDYGGGFGWGPWGGGFGMGF